VFGGDVASEIGDLGPPFGALAGNVGLGAVDGGAAFIGRQAPEPLLGAVARPEVLPRPGGHELGEGRAGRCSRLRFFCPVLI
jgi:hypothetical protein